MKPGSEVVVRRLQRGDEVHIQRLFKDTLLLGRPAVPRVRFIDEYSDICLGWFLESGRRFAALAFRDGVAAGYALACDNPRAQSRRALRGSAVLAPKLATAWARGALGPDSKKFYSSRLADSRTLWSGPAVAPSLLQVHLNVADGQRSGTVALALRDHLDRTASELRLDGWYGEMNALVGRRAHALERLGLRVVHRAPNRTLTAMLGQPVERLTVVRSLLDTDRCTTDAASSRPGSAP
jgi:hypothetical protein